MKKKEAIRKGINDLNEFQPAPSYAEQQRMILQKKKDDARPAVLKRIGAGIIDFLLAGALAGGFFAIAYFTIFPNVGYQSSVSFMIDTYESSHLYAHDENSSNYVYLTSKYNDETTPENNYDVPLTYFYSTNHRAVLDNELEKYINRKLESGYYYINENDECVRKNDVSRETAKTYLEKEYYIAINYLFKDPDVIQAARILNYTIPTTILITVIIGCSVFYFLIPLVDTKRRTFGYMILRIMPVDSDTIGLPRRTQITLRSFIFVVLNYISFIMIGFFLNGFAFAFIPFFINTMVLCFSRSNSGIHDYGTKIIVINESGTNALAMAKQMLGEGE